MTQADPSPERIAADDAMCDFMSELNDHISARVCYDRDGPRYAGENPPDQASISTALNLAVLTIIRAAIG